MLALRGRTNRWLNHFAFTFLPKTMMIYLLCKISLFLILLHTVPQADGKTNLEVSQLKLMTAEAGQSVNISCSFFHDSPSYIAKWTQDCNDSVYLTDQTCYNGRISIINGNPTNKTTDSGTLCCERYTILTITSVTENDSGMYCCHIQTAIGHKKVGSGTRLKVTPRVTPRSYPPDTDQDKDMKTYVLYAVAGAEACIILVLLFVGVKYRLRGSSQIESQVFEEKLEHDSKLHYAEICQSNRSKRAKGKRPEERVTYAPVKMHQ